MSRESVPVPIRYLGSSRRPCVEEVRYSSGEGLGGERPTRVPRYETDSGPGYLDVGGVEEEVSSQVTGVTINRTDGVPDRLCKEGSTIPGKSVETYSCQEDRLDVRWYT